MTADNPDVLERLDRVIGRLADGSAPLDDLVAAHQEALKLLEEAEAELLALRAKAGELGSVLGT